MNDPLVRLASRAMLRAASDRVDIEMQLAGNVAFRPIATMLVMARDEAAEAMAALVLADAESPKEIRELQNKVLRFDDLVAWTNRIIAAGKDAEHLSNEEVEDVKQYLVDTGQDEEARQLGLTDEKEEVNDA